MGYKQPCPFFSLSLKQILFPPRAVSGTLAFDFTTTSKKNVFFLQEKISEFIPIFSEIILIRFYRAGTKTQARFSLRELDLAFLLLNKEC